MPTEKKLKILMFSKIFGGKNTFIHNELVNLKNDFDITYLALEEIENIKLKEEFNTFKVIPFKENIFYRKMKWWLWKSDVLLSFKNSTFGRKLRKEVNEIHPDVIHLQFGYEALIFLDNCYDPKVPYIIHFHGYDASAMFKKRAYIQRLKFYLSKENVHQIYVSSFIKSRFIAHNLDVSRSEIIRCGIDLSKFEQKEVLNKTRQSKWIFTQVSSQVEKKGIPYAISGFSDFVKKNKDLDATFYITGSPTKENELLVKELNLKNKIIFTGLLTHTDVQKLLINTDVFIHCSVTSVTGDEEGIPTAIMEALAMRIPVLSTFHSGIPELIENHVHGILVEERNSSKISEALNQLVMMKPIKIDMHQYLTDKKYDLNSHLIELSSLYNKLGRS